MEIKLLTTNDQYDDLHRLADSRALAVRVDKEALSHLLTDHAVALAALQEKGVKLIDPRPRVKLEE